MKSGYSSGVIAEVLDGWLNAEVRSSGVDNTYLDDYKTAIEGLKGGYGHPKNFTAGKHESHVHIRLPQAWETFVMTLEPDTPEESRDYQSAWLLFTPLMQVSGTYRNQCYMEASNANDYLTRRMSRPTALDMRQVVSDRLRVWLPEPDNFADATITTEVLGRQLKLVSEAGSKAVKIVCARAAMKYDFGSEHSRSALAMIGAQSEWASFATDCVVLAAKIRNGELAKVPFLEPKSISADPPPAVKYPLRPDFHGWFI